MTWAQRLKRVFWIDIETFQHCGGAVRVIASIEDPVVIEKILTHLERREAALLAAVLPNPVQLQVDQPSDYVRERRDWILGQMSQLGGITFLSDL